MAQNSINEQKKTIPWINNAKAVCMLIVFLFHSEWYLDYRLHCIDSFYDPFFVNCYFFLSGYLLFRKQLSQPVINERVGEYGTGGGRLLLSNALFRIAIPSVLFALIEFFPKKLVRGEAVDYKDMLLETFGGCTYWFTSGLFIAEVFLFLLLLTRSKKIYFYFICGLIIACFGVYFKKNPLFLLGNEYFPWFYARGMVGVAYIAVGGLYWKYEESLNCLLNKFSNFVVIVSLMILFVILIWLVGQCESIVVRTIASYIRNCVGIIMVIRICMLVKEYKRMKFIGVNSLGFYLLSGALPNIYSIVFNKIPNLPMPVTLMLVVALSVVTAYAIMMVLTKYFQWLFDLRLLRKIEHV